YLGAPCPARSGSDPHRLHATRDSPDRRPYRNHSHSSGSRAMTRYMALAAPTVLTLVMTGCAVGPDYNGPPRKISDHASGGGALFAQDDKVVAQNPLPAHWWRLYQDSRLNSLMEEGLAENIDLRVADAHIQEAVSVVLEAQAVRTPVPTLSGGFEYGKGGIPT